MAQNLSQWISVDVTLARAQWELAMDHAMTLGGLGIVEQETSFQVSYPMSDQVPQILEDLKAFLSDLDPDAAISHDIVDRENWNRNWQAFFKPTLITDDLIVLPEWEDPQNYPQKVITRIRPAMAFGTGTHETTQLCLEMLENSVRPGDSVLDVGTGSAILGITALHLGAAHVDALENDPFTEENIHDNLELNGINSGFDLQISETPELKTNYDLMVINIIKARLFPILPDFFQVMGSSGRVIVSGLLATEDQETRKLLGSSPWKILSTYTKNEWIAYLCEAP